MRISQVTYLKTALARPASILKSGPTTINSRQMKKLAMTILNSVRSALRRRAAYLRTKRQIEALPLDVALDLDLHREDAAKIANRAVYG